MWEGWRSGLLYIYFLIRLHTPLRCSTTVDTWLSKHSNHLELRPYVPGNVFNLHHESSSCFFQFYFLFYFFPFNWIAFSGKSYHDRQCKQYKHDPDRLGEKNFHRQKKLVSSRASLLPTTPSPYIIFC